MSIDKDNTIHEDILDDMFKSINFKYIGHNVIYSKNKINKRLITEERIEELKAIIDDYILDKPLLNSRLDWR